MSVRVFYDPHRVEQLRQQGIRPRRLLGAGTTGAGTTGMPAMTGLELAEATERLRSEVDRLRGDNQRLVDEGARLRLDNQRLADEVRRLSGASTPQLSEAGSGTGSEVELDDAARRFSLLELDL